MGFKRTSEGRVFFQGADEGANRQANDGFEKKPSQAQKQPGLAANAAPQTQMQIVTLLKTLNERLKITQAERNKMARELESYRTLIEELEEKSVRNEQATRALQQKISTGGSAQGGQHAEVLARDALAELEETRKLLLDLESKANRADQGVSALKKLQQEQAEKMAVSINHAAALTKRVKDTEAKQEQIDARVEDTLSQQARLGRRIDKAVEERARFMRKIERIEETVLQTRDSLNAKAMVLLTDQGVAGQTGAEAAEYAEARTHVSPDARPANAGAWWRSPQAQAAGLSAVILASVFGGWFLNKAQNPQTTYDEYVPVTVASIEPTTAPSQQVDITAMDWSIEEDTSAFNETGVAPSQERAEQAVQAPSANDDIGTLNLNDQQQVEALLDENPDAVAAALNQIEPPEAYPDSIIPPEPVKQASIEPASERPPVVKAPAPAPREAAPRPAPKDPRQSMKPDSSLPDVVKKIEEQAFDGVPEAQHDLAAIYTAGHGGVKQDYKKAAFWFEQAADRGVGNAAYNLGVLHHQGLGVKADMNKAIDWYSRAATLGHPEAQYNLGIAYIEGIGVPYDPQRAADYFTNAAQSGITEAAYNLGLIYENGLLGEATPDKALVWYKTAADQGSPEAKQALEQLAQSLNVTLEEVNRLAESMKGMKKSENAQAPVRPQPAESAPLSLTELDAIAAPAQQAPAPTNAMANEQIMIAQIQEYLMRMGLYPGPADGITGPLTQDAIRSYQRLHSLQADGRASDGLLSHMLANVIGNALSEEGVEQGSRAE